MALTRLALCAMCMQLPPACCASCSLSAHRPHNLPMPCCTSMSCSLLIKELLQIFMCMQLLASIKNVAACAGQPEYAGMRQFALALGATPTRCKELYKITFLQPPASGQVLPPPAGQTTTPACPETAATAQPSTAAASMPAASVPPTQKQLREMARKLLRKLLMGLASIPEWEKDTAPTKMHLLAHCSSSILQPSNITAITAGSPGSGAPDVSSIAGHGTSAGAASMQVLPYVQPGCSSAGPLQSSYGTAGAGTSSMPARPAAVFAPKPALAVALQRAPLQVRDR